MKTEVNPKDTNRAEAFELWMSSPMPMVTLTKTFDVSNLVRACKRLGVRFNAAKFLANMLRCKDLESRGLIRSGSDSIYIFIS